MTHELPGPDPHPKWTRPLSPCRRMPWGGVELTGAVKADVGFKGAKACRSMRYTRASRTGRIRRCLDHARQDQWSPPPNVGQVDRAHESAAGNGVNYPAPRQGDRMLSAASVA